MPSELLMFLFLLPPPYTLQSALGYLPSAWTRRLACHAKRQGAPSPPRASSPRPIVGERTKNMPRTVRRNFVAPQSVSMQTPACPHRHLLDDSKERRLVNVTLTCSRRTLSSKFHCDRPSMGSSFSSATLLILARVTPPTSPLQSPFLSADSRVSSSSISSERRPTVPRLNVMKKAS